MANQRAPLDAETLRDTRDDLLQRVTDHTRQTGHVPDVRAAEQLIDPILRKVEVDHVSDRQRDLVRAEAGLRSDGRASDGTLTAAGRRRGPKPLAQVGGIKSSVVAGQEPDLAQEHARIRLIRMMAKELLGIPEWKDRLKKVGRMCGRHDGVIIPAVQTCFDCSRRERALRQVIARAVKEFGHPQKPRENKLIVSG